MTRGRILYVEDNFENRTLIKRILESEGFTVVEAENGLTGITSAETYKPDLILMDINLPDIDGYECAARIRKNTALTHTPIVALTANVMEGDRQRALDAGLDGYIPKPIDVDILPRQIADHLRASPVRRKVAPPAPEVPGVPAAAPLPPLVRQRPSAPITGNPAPRTYGNPPPPPPPAPQRTVYVPAPPPPAPATTNRSNPAEGSRE
jgi:two-component system cell cycle response regulator DivK